jgi:hypothetical protein
MSTIHIYKERLVSGTSTVVFRTRRKTSYMLHIKKIRYTMSLNSELAHSLTKKAVVYFAVNTLVASLKAKGNGIQVFRPNKHSDSASGTRCLNAPIIAQRANAIPDKGESD